MKTNTNITFELWFLHVKKWLPYYKYIPGVIEGTGNRTRNTGTYTVIPKEALMLFIIPNTSVLVHDIQSPETDRWNMEQMRENLYWRIS